MLRERFLAVDRDGVINEDSDDYIKSAEEWRPIEGSIEGISRLTLAGFRIAVISNQSGISRGLIDFAALNQMHRKLRECLALCGGRVEMILYCPHAPRDHCSCRKPQTGLLLDLSRRVGFSLVGHSFVGDSMTDIEAARRMGMEAILVKTGKGQRTLRENAGGLDGVQVFENLKAVVDSFLISGVGA